MSHWQVLLRILDLQEDPYAQLEGPHQSVGVDIPNSMDYTEAWESISPTQGATQLCGFMSPYPQLKGPPKFCGFQVCGQNPAVETGFPKSPQVLTRIPLVFTKKKNPNLTKQSPKVDQKTPKPYQKDPQSLLKKTPQI